MPHAAVVHELDQPMRVEEVTYRPLHEGEVLVKITACGLCHSDLLILEARLPCQRPVILGHEAAGVVIETGAKVTSVAKGAHVVALWRPSCGKCRYCRRGKSHLCKMGDDPTSLALDRVTAGGKGVAQFLGIGGFSEMTILSENSLVKIDPAMPLTKAALLGCAVITGFGAAKNTAGIVEGDEVAVFGCGGVGLNIIQGARHCGASVVVAVDVNPAKLEMAKTFGATHTVNGTDADAINQIKAATTEGQGVDYAFEAVGISALAQSAVGALAKGGEVILVGVAPVRETIPLSPFFTWYRENGLRGSVAGSTPPAQFIPQLISLHHKKQLKLDELMTRSYTLREANEAMDDLKQGKNARGVLVF